MPPLSHDKARVLHRTCDKKPRRVPASLLQSSVTTQATMEPQEKPQLDSREGQSTRHLPRPQKSKVVNLPKADQEGDARMSRVLEEPAQRRMTDRRWFL